MKLLTKLFYLALFVLTLYAHIAKSQDTLGLEYVNTRPEIIKLKDGSTLKLVDEWWKYLQVINQVNVDKTYLIRKGSVGLFTLFQLPDTINAYEVTVTMKKREVTIPAPVIIATEVNNNDPAVRYSAGWNYQPVDRTKTPPITWPDPFLNDDVHFTYQKDAWVEYTFIGDSVEVYSEYQANHGKARIEIRNNSGSVVHSEVVNMYNGTTINSRDKIFARRFPKGTYTIRVILAETNTTITPKQDSMVIDSFRSYSIN